MYGSNKVLLSPLRNEGFGLSDGEVMERLWSYLRRFSRMTKEMRPAHRVDVLTHALLYYGFSIKQKLGMYYISIMIEEHVKTCALIILSNSKTSSLSVEKSKANESCCTANF